MPTPHQEAGIEDANPNEMFICPYGAHSLVNEMEVETNNYNVKETAMWSGEKKET